MDLNTESDEKKRLIVLITDDLAGNLQLAYKIHWMAALDKRDVFFLALVDGEEQWLTTSRHLATMKAATCSEQIKTTSKLILRDNWLKTLQETYNPGDIVVCQQEQSVSIGFMKTIPMQEFLQGTMKIPIRSMSGLYHPWQIQVSHWIHNVVFWLGGLIILGIFSYLEIQIENTAEGLARIALWFIVICFEFGTLLAWNRLPRH